MLLDEGKMAALLQKEHKHGYDIIVEEEAITVKSSGWMVSMEQEKIPRKVLGVLVEHMGLLPQAPASMTVVKKAENQELLWDMAIDEMNAMRNTQEAAEARLTPIMFRGLTLFQTQEYGKQLLYGVSSGLSRILDTLERGALVLDGDRILWAEEGQKVWLECYRPHTGAEAERWKTLETVNWIERE